MATTPPGFEAETIRRALGFFLASGLDDPEFAALCAEGSGLTTRRYIAAVRRLAASKGAL